MLPGLQSTLPPELNMKLLFDQSLFVRASIDGVIKEGLTAACLTAAMILLFLGNWRSTLIIGISIPLSILVSIITLSALGETFNIMTLGGLALAVGILVDDATVEIENIERNLGMQKELKTAILDGAQQLPCRRLFPRWPSALCLFRCSFSPGWRAIVCSPGGSGRVRHAGVVSAFENHYSHAGDVPVART